MMNPNVNEPEWIKQREVLWEDVFLPYYLNAKPKEYSKKQLELIKPFFMTGVKPDYVNEPDWDPTFNSAYRTRAKAYKYAFVHHGINDYFSPYQNSDLWLSSSSREVLTLQEYSKQTERSLDEQVSYYLKGALSFDSSRTVPYCWDVVTEVEYFYFLMGEEYQPVNYDFQGLHLFDKNPISAEYLFDIWLRNISFLFNGVQYNRAGDPVINKNNKWYVLNQYVLSAACCFPDYFEKGVMEEKRYIKSYRYTWKRVLRLLYLVSGNPEKAQLVIDEDDITYEEFMGSYRVEYAEKLLNQIENYAPSGLKLARDKVLEGSKDPLYTL